MKISTGTIARTIVLALALVNQIFVIVGIPILDIDETIIYELCSLIFTAVMAIITWWKNNSFSKAAIKADALKNACQKRTE